MLWVSGTYSEFLAVCLVDVSAESPECIADHCDCLGLVLLIQETFCEHGCQALLANVLSCIISFVFTGKQLLLQGRPRVV